MLGKGGNHTWLPSMCCLTTNCHVFDELSFDKFPFDELAFAELAWT